MAKPRFSTVADEFLHVAEGTHDFLVTNGFRVSVEATDIEYPRTPTLLAKRAHSTLFVEVAGSFRKDVALAWARYGTSCDRDVQVVMAIANKPGLAQSDLEFATQNKVGIYTCDLSGHIAEMLAPVDLAFHVALPILAEMPVRLRAILAPIYGKFDKADWRDGFRDACTALEEEARKYLKVRSVTTGVAFLDPKGKPITLGLNKISKATLGSLGVYFLGITTPNILDSLLAKTLPIINPERILIVHKKGAATTEKRLRKRAGQQMYVIINCLREIVSRR